MDGEEMNAGEKGKKKQCFNLHQSEFYSSWAGQRSFEKMGCECR